MQLDIVIINKSSLGQLMDAQKHAKDIYVFSCVPKYQPNASALSEVHLQGTTLSLPLVVCQF